MKRLMLALVLIWIVYIVGREIFYQIKYLWLPASLIFSNSEISHVEAAVLKSFSSLGETTKQDIKNDSYTLSNHYIDIDNNGSKDLIVTMDAASTCGSAGCVTKIFIQHDRGSFEPINFSYALTDIEILESITNGMRDLEINGNDTSRMVWNGSMYELETI